MTRPLVTVLALAALFGPGCAAAPVPAPAGEVDRRALYQRIANALPRAEFGWGDPPGVIDMAASTRAEGREPPPAAEVCNERGFRVTPHVYRPRSVWVPYQAIETVTAEWRVMPNALLVPLVIAPLQARRLTVVIDASRIPGLLEGLQADAKRLEGISREIGLGGPWAFAQQVKNELAAVEAEHGAGRLAIHFDYMVPIPAAIPWRGEDWRTGQAFAWAAAHPDAPELESEDDGGEAERD